MKPSWWEAGLLSSVVTSKKAPGRSGFPDGHHKYLLSGAPHRLPYNQVSALKSSEKQNLKLDYQLYSSVSSIDKSENLNQRAFV
jgi:hypothetical protein